MPFNIIRGDIAKTNADVIVNAANTELQQGGGVCGAIFNAAGARELQAACDKLSPIKTGEAVITPGFNLQAKYIIHAVGVVWRGGKHNEEELLRLAYINSLKLAVENNCESIAFPLISSGIYGYPKGEALRVATEAIREFITAHDINVSLVIFDKDSFAVSDKLLEKVESYINKHYIDEYYNDERIMGLREAEELRYERAYPPKRKMAMPAPAKAKLDDLIGNLDEPFSQTLLRLIDSKGKTDVEVYKRANLDRKLFSKIRTGKGYAPSKKTVLALAVALELSLDETADLLKRAGFALSQSSKFDVIIEYFIVNKKYDIFEINNVLFSYDQALLGG